MLKDVGEISVVKNGMCKHLIRSLSHELRKKSRGTIMEYLFFLSLLSLYLILQVYKEPWDKIKIVQRSPGIYHYYYR